MVVTEKEANGKTCPLKVDSLGNVFKCIASDCMWWKLDSTEYSKRDKSGKPEKGCCEKIYNFNRSFLNERARN